VEFTLMRIAREAVTNAVKHARAKRIEIGLRTAGPELVMEIADDGVGFVEGDVKEKQRYGLVGMRERAEEIGAGIEIESAAGRGTVVRVKLGLHERSMGAKVAREAEDAKA
jgi:NarL family two-component system sensor histidine kinase LiaS